MCPNCFSKEISDFLKKGDLESHLGLKKCWDCNCVFLTFIFKESLEELVNV